MATNNISKETEIYLEIAERYIKSAETSIQANFPFSIQEAIGFKNYHAFESIAGAFNSYIGQPVSRVHAVKLNKFVHNYKRNAFAKVSPKTIYQLTIFLNSLRNKFLYPEITPSGYIAPKEQITLKDATDLTKRIRGVIDAMKLSIC